MLDQNIFRLISVKHVLNQYRMYYFYEPHFSINRRRLDCTFGDFCYCLKLANLRFAQCAKFGEMFILSIIFLQKVRKYVNFE
jgi:hypothetical protein